MAAGRLVLRTLVTTGAAAAATTRYPARGLLAFACGQGHWEQSFDFESLPPCASCTQRLARHVHDTRLVHVGHQLPWDVDCAC
jgi:hypothetical protein